jgi:drug/metabolite transporter (DMT)-like permease
MTIGGLPCPEHGTGPSTGGLLMVGVILSVIADAIISVSLNLQKHAHNRNWDHAAGKPKRPFTRLPLWWVGMLLNVFGELGNLVAYGFAPASVVTPVGSVGVFCNAILASFFLKEPLRKRDLVGLCFIVAGVVLIVMGVPEAPGVLTAHVIAHEVMPHPRCWAYLLALSLGVAALLVLARLGYGKRYLLVYLLLCSLISSVTVIAARAFSSMTTIALGLGAVAADAVGEGAAIAREREERELKGAEEVNEAKAARLERGEELALAPGGEQEQGKELEEMPAQEQEQEQVPEQEQEAAAYEEGQWPGH